MATPLSDEALDTIFRKARTHTAFLPKLVDDSLLREVYDLAKLGPTSANTCPMRILFLKSQAAKERLKPSLEEGNKEKTMKAPVCAIIADDSRFYEFVPRLFPHYPQIAEVWKGPGNEEGARIHAFRNSTLQGAYFILAARAKGLDVGGMSGFDNAKVDAEFFPDGRWKSNFLLNIGFGDSSKLHPREPRLDFDEVCKII